MKPPLVITLAKQTGGKAGKNRAKTSTIQVREYVNEGYLLKKQFRFQWENFPKSFLTALTKAESFVKEQGREVKYVYPQINFWRNYEK